MSKLISIILLAVVATNISAKEIILNGDLIDSQSFTGRIFKVIITEENEEVKLVNEYFEAQSCENGEFALKEESLGKYRLEAVLNCKNWVDQPEETQFCPEIFSPVCGAVSGIDGDMLINYSNSCELYRAKAIFVKEGSCE
ncbi:MULTISPECIES: Kazal-type serine protease inhibitor family protein [Halobacteriovorax]|uniref:Kazal-like domain-containing protein n=1 Tax=Halobacteriovorax vibrionivorans TaxID=2152716 RepID=A0ABY0IFT2_9BACT|nr:MULTISPECIES: Kazal-type serine protease inhibitor [Halobacteriovorax]AYF44884.1 hypothetical protein BALOs_1884 [Halobacteriovorax sp. BALOs_7]RZF20958.1 hypothetical protein DAY19_13315 [Halobacteriovorax vibrionivorans]TGD46058.1 hypothetical protein EP118_13765 [Halobacteriovorax sp. Y22]